MLMLRLDCDRGWGLLMSHFAVLESMGTTPDEDTPSRVTSSVKASPMKILSELTPALSLPSAP
jgi:hypothetical protein